MITMTLTTACQSLAHDATNLRVRDEIAKGKTDRAARLLLNRMMSFLDDVLREDTEGMNPDTLAVCTRILADFGPRISMEMGHAAVRQAMVLKRHA